MILRNVHISSATTGIKVVGGGSLQAENVTFDNVQTPFDINGVKSASIKGSEVINDPKLRRGTPITSNSLAMRRPKGAPLPVMCDNCKSIHPSLNYVFSGTFFFLWNNKEECQVCGSPNARLSEGLFNLSKELAEILTGSDLTYAMLKAISQVAEEAAAGNVPAETAIEAIRKENSQIGGLFAKAWNLGVPAVAFLANLIVIATAPFTIYQTYLSYRSLSVAERQTVSPPPPSNDHKLLEEWLNVMAARQQWLNSDRDKTEARHNKPLRHQPIKNACPLELLYRPTVIQ